MAIGKRKNKAKGDRDGKKIEQGERADLIVRVQPSPQTMSKPNCPPRERVYAHSS